MIELFKNNKEWITNRVCFDVKTAKDGVLVDFVKLVYGDNNKWHVAKVLTDAIVYRYILDKNENNPEYIKKYIMENATEDMEIMGEIEKNSNSKKNISISLPTSTYAKTKRASGATRMVNNDFYPLVVYIDDKDVSSSFWDFEIFGAKAVNVAYDLLVDGIAPVTDNTLSDFTSVEQLNKDISTANSEHLQ